MPPGRPSPCTAVMPASSAFLAALLLDPAAVASALGSLATWLAGRSPASALLASFTLVLASFRGLGLPAALAGLAAGGALLACGAARGWERLVAVSLASWAWATAMLAGLSRPLTPPGLEWVQSRGGQAFLWLLTWMAAAYMAYNAYAPPARPASVPRALAGAPAMLAGARGRNPMMPWRALALALTVLPAMVESSLAAPLLIAGLAWLAARLKGVEGPATLTMIYMAAYALAIEALGLGRLYVYALTQLGLLTPG